MAQRDYGQRAGQRRPPPRRGGGGMPGWIWGVVGLSVGLGVAALVYINRPAGPMPGQRGAPVAREGQRPAPTASPAPRAFTFYELLPNQEVVVPDAAGDRPATAKPATPEQYLIQVASYRNPDDADRQKASLALLGLEARVETVTIDGRETYYRVRLGPLTGLEAAQKMVAQLDENGIDALLVKVR